MDAPWLRQLDQRAVQDLLARHPEARTLWYWAGIDGNKQVYLLRPVDEHHASEGWLGLELTEIDLALDPPGPAPGQIPAV